MSNENIDPAAVGFLVGMQYGSIRADAEFRAERERLRAALAQAEIDRLSEEAQKNAAKACVGAVVGELAKVSKGEPFVRRHSDPEATAARGEDFIDTAEDNLNRLSSGRLSFSHASVSRIKRAGVDVNDIATRDAFKPEPQVNSPRSPRSR